jgi:hypothetical protein
VTNDARSRRSSCGTRRGSLGCSLRPHLVVFSSSREPFRRPRALPFLTIVPAHGSGLRPSYDCHE